MLESLIFPGDPTTNQPTPFGRFHCFFREGHRNETAQHLADPKRIHFPTGPSELESGDGADRKRFPASLNETLISDRSLVLRSASGVKFFDEIAPVVGGFFGDRGGLAGDGFAILDTILVVVGVQKQVRAFVDQRLELAIPWFSELSIQRSRIPEQIQSDGIVLVLPHAHGVRVARKVLPAAVGLVSGGVFLGTAFLDRRETDGDRFGVDQAGHHLQLLADAVHPNRTGIAEPFLALRGTFAFHHAVGDLANRRDHDRLQSLNDHLIGRTEPGEMESHFTIPCDFERPDE